MFDPNRGRLQRTFLKAAKLVLAAFATATILEAALPIDLPAAKQDVGDAPQINFDIENAELYHHPAELHYTQEQVSSYLGFALKSKQKALDKPLLDFKRAFVNFAEGKCTITVERSLFGYPLQQSASFAVSVNEGKLVAASKGGAVGRLSLHPLVMQFGDIIFADVWSALDRERKLIAKTGGIEFHDGSVTLATSGKVTTGGPSPSPSDSPVAQPKAP
jgi:hypothetical protein